MNRIKIKMNKNLLIVLVFLLFNIGYGQTNTWRGGAAGSTQAWETATNWSAGHRPTVSEDVVIPFTTFQPIIVAGAFCKSIKLSNSIPGQVILTVNSGSLTVSNSLEMDSSTSLRIVTGTVIVTGDVIMSELPTKSDVTFSGAGSLIIGGKMAGGILNAGPGLVNYNSATGQDVGAYTYNDLTLSGSGIKTINTNTVVNDVLSMEGTATTSAAPTYGAVATLRYNSTVVHTAGLEWITNFISSGGVIITNTGAVKIVAVEKKMGKDIRLYIDSGSSLLISGKPDFYLGGNLINLGKLESDGDIYIYGDGEAQSIDGFTAGGIVMTKGAGIATFMEDMNSGHLTINGLGGTLNLGSNLTHTFDDWIRTKGILDGTSCLVKFSGNVVGTGGTFISGTSTVEYNGGIQDLGTGSITYNNIVLSGTGIKTFGAKTTINETISIVDEVVANLTAGLVHSAKSIKLGVALGNGGSWGSSLSNAVNKNNTFFVSNNGIINVGPTIVIDTNTLVAMTSTYGTPSESKSFTISGIAMVEAVVVTAPLGFEVSKDGITFTDTVSVGGVGSFGDTTLFVRLKGTIMAAVDYYYGNIVLTSKGTTDVNIAIAKSTVNKAPLTITTVSDKREYGSENPVLTASYDEFKNGDNVESLGTLFKIQTTAVKESPVVGSYSITASGAASSNYTITYSQTGFLTIDPAELIIKAINTSKTHGDENPILLVEYIGFKNGDTAAQLNPQVVINTDAKEDSPIGKYSIKIEGAFSSNYKINFVDGILDVVASNNAGLSDIINKGDLDPTFDPDKKGYTVVVPNEINSYVINPVPSNPNATVVMTIDGVIIDPTVPFDLKVGDNEIKIFVTAEDGVTKEEYTVIVTREEAPVSNNAGLIDLAISEGILSPAFTEGTTNYTASVPNDITSITITPFSEDATATITVNGVVVPSGTASADLPLKVGENEIITKVTAQDGTVNTYTVIVTRKEAKAPDNAGLSDIVISDGTLSPAFNTDTNDYRIDVPYSTDSIIINPKPIDPAATVEMIINGTTISDNTAPIALNVGDNVITVVVTAPDGTQDTYTVIVNRADATPQAIIPSNIITPNGDGKNDFWIIPGIELYQNNSVKVFDRAARLVYSKNKYSNDWDGSYKGSPLNEDTYYYLIDLGSGQPKVKGFITIIRN
ncbi:cadherin-like beta sandwich domain-containing protein [Flavobacterium sp.]|uniref:cadherin-like beta sandwich domain-containing protein n=1 Tax=Flavobacterium sp. TaxID=239 RepID=UPI00374CE0BC